MAAQTVTIPDDRRDTITAAVETAIGAVDDPCSLAAGAPLNVFELGLVREWTVRPDRSVHVVVSPTAPSCILIGSIIDGLSAKIGAVPGVRAVSVEIDSTTIWSPELMSTPGRTKLDSHRAGSRQQLPLRPRQWQEERPLQGP
jgi:metal-sulfur cluster biosynthetic enzyme